MRLSLYMPVFVLFDTRFLSLVSGNEGGGGSRGGLQASLPKKHSRLRGVTKVEAGYKHHTPKTFLYIIVGWIGVIKKKGGGGGELSKPYPYIILGWIGESKGLGGGGGGSNQHYTPKSF